MDAAEADRDDRGVGAEDAARLRRALDEEARRHLRLRADFENLRRRTAQERDAARREGWRAALLPGVAAIQRLFMRALREAGAEAVESVGRPFDPGVYEAVATAPSDGVEPGTVAREVRRGWRLGDELLRPA